MIKIRGCRFCRLGDNCLCHLVTYMPSVRVNSNAVANRRYMCMPLTHITPADFNPGYRRKYLINTHGIDPDDTTNADRFVEIVENYLLPNTDPNRRYNGDGGYRSFINDLDATKTKPIPW